MYETHETLETYTCNIQIYFCNMRLKHMSETLATYFCNMHTYSHYNIRNIQMKYLKTYF
jgi:hypothetical protein